LTKEIPQEYRRYLSPGLFLLALVLRLLYLAEIRDTPYFDTLVLDAYEYDRLADELLEGNWLLAYDGGYVHGLLYPCVLSLLKLCGAGHLAVRLFQAVLSSLSCVFVYRLAGCFFPRSVSLIAGLLAAFYWPFIFYGGELLATTLVIFLELALVLLLVRAEGRASVAAAGVLFGLLATARGNLLLLAPVLLWWLLRTAPRPRRPSLLLAFSLGFILAFSPFLLRSYLAQGSPLPFQGGWSFYMGSNPAADGTPYARQGITWQRLELLPIQRGITAPAEKGIFYVREGLRFIWEQPAAYLSLLYRKFGLFWHAAEIPVSADLRYYERHSLLGRVLVLDFGVIAPLALVGMLWGWRQRRDRFLLYGFVLAYLVSGLLFSVCARYRLPAVPFLLIFAASGIWQLGKLLRDRHLPTAGAFLLTLAASAVLVHTGVDLRQVEHLRSPWLLGHVYLRNQQYDLAEQAYLSGLQDFPEDPDMRNSLGVVYEFQGRNQEAEIAYLAAVERAPDHARARINLGKLYLKQQRLEEARAALEEALASDLRPANQHEGRYHLGYVYLFQKAYHRAYQSFARALEFQERARAYYGLANACAHLGRAQEQVRALERAVRLDPGFAPAYRNLGVLYLQRGDYVAAERALLQAVRRQPGSAAAYRHLAALYARLGKQEQARAALQAARRLQDAGTHR